MNGCVVAVEFHGCRSSIAMLQSLQLLEQAATEQLTARRRAEHALVDAHSRIEQLDQALQQGARSTASVDQVLDTRVLGRPDKWDGSEKAWPNWRFVMKAHAGAIDQHLSTGMTSAEISTDALSNESMTPRKQSRSVQLYLVLIMLCTGQSLEPHRQCSAWLGHGGVADALSGAFSQAQCKVGCDDARGVGASVRHERCGEQSGDDGTEDQGFVRYANIENPEILMNSYRLITLQAIRRTR